MALRDRKISTAPNTRPDPAHGTVYQASRGGWLKPPAKPTPGTPKETRR
ncbi:hypothetical protein [Streptomyces jumonjinensis]|nr:hypothetical protein [Streptomyces jumonjinensis]